MTALQAVTTGLLLTVVQLRLFGVDLTDDTIGFGLVLLGVLRLPPTPWRTVGTVGAGTAALVCGVGYGAPAARLLPAAFPGWMLVAELREVATAATVVGLLMAVRGGQPAGVRRALPVASVGYVVVLAAWMLLVSGEHGYAGTPGHLRQLLAAGLGAVPILALAALLLYPGEPSPHVTGRLGDATEAAHVHRCGR